MPKPDENPLRVETIAKILDQLRKDNDEGEIACLVTIVVNPDGAASHAIYGTANNITLLGSFQYLNGVILKNQFENESDEETSSVSRMIS